MTKRAWIFVGMIATTPFLMFTALLGCILIISFLLATCRTEWWIENRTSEPIWITPLGWGKNVPVVRIEHYTTRLPMLTSCRSDDILIEPGCKQRLVMTVYETYPMGFVVRTTADEYRFCKHESSDDFVLDDLSSLEKASPRMMSLTGNPPEHEEIFNGPLWVIITVIAAVGLAAPLVLRWLYRKLKSTPRFVAPPSACR